LRRNRPAETRSTKGNLLLLAPACLVLLGLLAFPLINLFHESFRLFIPGFIGAKPGAPYTVENYAELLDPAYRFYFIETFWLGFLASCLALVFAYPVAFRIARSPSAFERRAFITLLVAMVFLGTLVRVYAVLLALGPAGFGRTLSAALGATLNGLFYTEFMVVAGLLHFTIPMAALALLGTLQSVNPRLSEAAQALGANRTTAFFTVTLPLSTPGLLAAFVLCYTFCISAFVVPMILGKGRVHFASNLIYSRFGEVGNYPGGSAISIVLLVLSVGLLYLITRTVGRRMQRG
jgi:ABC-type spermidine/putrescine transport system permease subunit I